ncbi:hypothetical protein CRG98_010659 [Punica granatum]|uniref:Uncharacterized protein n=1 Tax=Punica granatum TaxID=22663 RepID=A0A2I0KKL3_PUNGR|nr:hypothetical protein CRG98_010659 [Punica granatum]
MDEVHVRVRYNAWMDVRRHGHARERSQQGQGVSTDVWMSRARGRACACKPKGRARRTNVGTCMGARLAGALARGALGYYSPESTVYTRNPPNDLKQ